MTSDKTRSDDDSLKLPSESQPTSSHNTILFDSNAQENDVVSFPSTPQEVYEERKLNRIDLANGTQTEFLYDAQKGDCFLGFTVSELIYKQVQIDGTWENQQIGVVFEGSQTVEGYYFYDPSSPEYVRLQGDEVLLPDLIQSEYEGFLNVLSLGFSEDTSLQELGKVEIEADEYSHKYDATKAVWPYFYCKLKVNNIRLAWKRESMAMRSADIVDVLEMNLVGYADEETRKALEGI